jgi:type IV secretory pathway VirB9-like protein
MKRFLIHTIIALVFVGCAAHEEVLPPALPEEPIIMEPFLVPEADVKIDMKECPASDPIWRKNRNKENSIGNSLKEPPRMESIIGSMDANIPKNKNRNTKELSPEMLIAQGNTQARMHPTASGYTNGKAIYHYPYRYGHIYDAYTNISTETLFYFQEKIATIPNLNPDEWVPRRKTLSTNGQDIDIFGVRPLEPGGYTADITLIAESGRPYMLHLMPAKYAMLMVTWDIADEPFTSMIPAVQREKPTPCSAQAQTAYHMPVELAQLHTSYTIQTKGSPAFVPTSVFDDGRKTMIRLKAIAGNAPTVFTYKGDGSRGLVQFRPYYIPDDPNKGLYIVVENIWPKLELVGTDGASVVLTRMTDAIKIAQPLAK